MQAFVFAPLLSHRPLSAWTSVTLRHAPRLPLSARRSGRVTPRCMAPSDRASEIGSGVRAASSGLQPGSSKRLQVNGRELLYDYSVGSTPTIVFLPGYYFSRWQQAKANALKIFAKRQGQAFLAEEYLGTGKSDGDFATDGSLSQWIADSCAFVDRVPGKVILVGAGVGGWIMLHVAMQRPDKVVGIVGINPSLDFTHDLIKPSLTAEQHATLKSKGTVNITWGYSEYPISKVLLDDAEKWLVLRGGTNSLNITCPVRLLVGLNDEEIPADRILKFVDAVKSNDCVLSFIKLGDHSLEDESDMRRMWDYICELSSDYFEYDLTSPGSG